MKYENEVTVEVKITKDELSKILVNNGFTIYEEYDLIDEYYSYIDITSAENYLDVLKKCVLVRHIVEKDKETMRLTYKYKEYDSNGNIIKSGKADCNVYSITDACSFLEALEYKKIITIRDHLTIYSNETDEIALQEVNGRHTYIEIEENSNRINKIYTLDEMKNVFNKYGIPIVSNNYFVKKAEIEMIEKYGKK